MKTLRPVIFLILSLLCLNPSVNSQIINEAKQIKSFSLKNAYQNLDNILKIKNHNEAVKLIKPLTSQGNLQVKEKGYNTQISFIEGEPESEVHAAMNPTDTNNIIVSPVRQDFSGFFLSIGVPVYYTKDFGTTWQRSNFDGFEVLPFWSFPQGGGDPVITFDAKGNAHFTWLVADFNFFTLSMNLTLYHAISSDGGTNWKVQKPIDSGTFLSLFGENDVSLVDKEWLASDLSDSPYSNSVYASYTKFELSDTSYNIVVKRKTGTRNSFDNETAIVSADSFSLAQFSSIDVDHLGNVHVLYMAGVDSSSFSIYYNRSENGAQSFDHGSKISDFYLNCFPLGSDPECEIVGIDYTRIYPCIHLSADKSNGEFQGNLYAVWTANGISGEETQGLDVYFTRSTDGGNYWSTPIVLNNNDSPISDQFYPSIKVNDSGIVVIGWYDKREDENNVNAKYYLTYSFDGGTTFVPDFPVSTQSSDMSKIGGLNNNFGIGEYVQVVTSTHYALPFWADGRSNDGNIGIYMAKVPLHAPSAEGLANQKTPHAEVKTLSTEFSIQNISPNPTKASFFIDLQLNKDSEINIQLFDLKGKTVGNLTTQQLVAGQHRILMDASNIIPGTYLCYINTNFGFESKLVVIQE